jgi:hypothetical protein
MYKNSPYGLLSLVIGAATALYTPMITIPGSPFSDVFGESSAALNARHAALFEITNKIAQNAAGEITGKGSATYTQPSFWTWRWAPKEVDVSASVVGKPIVDRTGAYFTVRYRDDETGKDIYGSYSSYPKYHLPSQPRPKGYEERNVIELNFVN